MKLRDLLRDVEVLEMHADGDCELRDICYDSRQAAEGSAFVAVRGFETDGHRYIAAAAERGTECAVCEERPQCGIPYVIVRDSRLALALMSRNLFGDPASEMTVIGVTGTNGKTTTTYLLKHLLEVALDARVGLIGTNGNMIGSEFLHTERTTPESYELQKLFREMADSGCTHVVMEVSSHSLVLHRVAGIHFAVGIFTNLTQDHLDFHHTMEAYAEAKAELFDMCSAAAINLDDGWAQFMLDRCRCPVLTFGESGRAGLRAEDIALSASGVEFTAEYEGQRRRISLGIPGMFSVHNALGVMACALCLGLDLESCRRALADAKGVKGRVEVVPTDGDYTVLSDYAHTPDALENVLRAMRAVTKGRVVALFGCGGDRDRTKRPIMGRIAAENADFAVVTSDNPRTEEPMDIIREILAGMEGTKTPYVVIPDRVEAIEWAIEHHEPGDVIILAGKGHEDYQVIGHEKRHMDEREIVAEIMEKRKMHK